MICDLDGDSRRDMVLINGFNLLVFYQDPAQNFRPQPHQRHRLTPQPTIIWPAELGRAAASLLVLTHAGVDELCFTNRIGPPIEKPIIRQSTILPANTDEPMIIYWPLSVRTSTGWPLVLVPVAQDLQLWQHGQTWSQTQTFEKVISSQVWQEPRRPGYSRWTELNLSLGDLNHDHREDLILRQLEPTGNHTHRFFLQNVEGTLAAQPALTFVEKPDGRFWHCWVDINQDHQVDLMKCTWLDDPWFIPGTRSGKVLVGIHMAGAQGRIPEAPQQVFRKNDWMSALPVVDVDGDGYLDLVLGHSLFDSREGVRKMITAKQLDFSLNFHFFVQATAFPKEPDFQRRLLLHLDRHSLHLTWSRREYFERFVNLTGDFNGDGKKDLLVKDRSSQVSVYFFMSRSQGFSQGPDLKFDCPDPIDRFLVTDLNQDGVSDLILLLKNHEALRILTSKN